MAITQTSDVTWDQAAYEKMAYFSLRPQLYFDNWATVKATNQSMNGASVVFDKVSDLAAATTALTENTDVTPATMGDAQVTVTLAEYGNAVQTTGKLRGTSYLALDPIVANLIGYNAGISIDNIAQTTMTNGTNVFYGGAATSRGTITASMNVTATKVRYARAKLVANNVRPIMGNLYGAIIHPDCAIDLREETGLAGWRSAHSYADGAPDQIWDGSIGIFEQFMFYESPRANLRANSGSPGTVDVYDTLFFGSEACAKAFSLAPEYGQDPRIVVGPVTDILRRFVPMGWKHLVGYGVFRQEAIWRLEAASTIGAN